MKSCDEITHLVSEGQERSLTSRKSSNCACTLLYCSGCRNFRKNIHFIRSAMKGFAAGRDHQNQTGNQDSKNDPGRPRAQRFPFRPGSVLVH